MTAAVAVMSASASPALPKRHGFSIESLIGTSDSTPPSPPPPPSLPHLPPTPSSSSAPAAALPSSSSSLSPSSLSLSSTSRSSPTITHSSSPFSSQTPSTTPKVTPAAALTLHSPEAPPLAPSPTRSSPLTAGSTSTSSPPPQRPLPIRPVAFSGRDSLREERLQHAKKDRPDSGSLAVSQSHRDRELRELRQRECREREMDLLREREARERDIVIESMRERERELREMREARDREIILRDRELRDLRDSREASNPGGLHHPHSSPRSLSPSSPRLEKSTSPETENRLSAWAGEEFKHLLGGFPGTPLDSNGLYQPLRVCNRALASMNGGLGGPIGPPGGPLGVGVPPQFGHLPINPLLYNLPRDMGSPQAHPLLAARYPGFMHPRYPMGPPPGLLFHPYRKPKRNRTAFSPSQLLQLEQAFEKNHYVVGQERKTLAAKLQLTETQVKVWFQNRRTKHKRMKAEEDGGSAESQGQDGGELTSFGDQDDEEDEACSEEEEEEELSVTEDT